jgi:hypothetical protein
MLRGDHAGAARTAGIAPSLQSVANGSQRVAVERLTSALALVHNASCAERSTNALSPAVGRRRTRIAHELEAVSKNSEVATQKILAADEDIDQAADPQITHQRPSLARRGHPVAGHRPGGASAALRRLRTPQMLFGPIECKH